MADSGAASGGAALPWVTFRCVLHYSPGPLDKLPSPDSASCPLMASRSSRVATGFCRSGFEMPPRSSVPSSA
jgi:hypothetical protein